MRARSLLASSSWSRALCSRDCSRAYAGIGFFHLAFDFQRIGLRFTQLAFIGERVNFKQDFAFFDQSPGFQLVADAR